MRSQLALCLILAIPSMMRPDFAGSAPLTEVALLGGTIVSIDQQTLTLTILFPAGDSRALPVRDSRLLQGLNIGDHVTFELNQEQTVIRIIKLPTDPAN